MNDFTLSDIAFALLFLGVGSAVSTYLTIRVLNHHTNERN